MKIAIRIDAADNVAMVMEPLAIGETVSVLSDEAVEVDRLAAAQEIPLPYHKIALTEIDEGRPVVKYGEIVGYATETMCRGDWVHMHNLASASFYVPRAGEQ